MQSGITNTEEVLNEINKNFLNRHLEFNRGYVINDLPNVRIYFWECGGTILMKAGGMDYLSTPFMKDNKGNFAAGVLYNLYDVTDLNNLNVHVSTILKEIRRFELDDVEHIVEQLHES